MDIVVIMFGSLIATMTALSFLELRRIRKIMESEKGGETAPKPPEINL